MVFNDLSLCFLLLFFFQNNKASINLEEVGRVFRVNVLSLAGAELLGLLHFHGEKVQVLVGHVLLRK